MKGQQVGDVHVAHPVAEHLFPPTEQVGPEIRHLPYEGEGFRGKSSQNHSPPGPALFSYRRDGAAISVMGAPASLLRRQNRHHAGALHEDGQSHADVAQGPAATGRRRTRTADRRSRPPRGGTLLRREHRASRRLPAISSHGQTGRRGPLHEALATIGWSRAR